MVPTVSTGFTDSHFFRDLGITSYGYSPFAFRPEEFAGVHGNDERVSVKNIVEGIKTFIVYWRTLRLIRSDSGEAPIGESDE